MLKSLFILGFIIVSTLPENHKIIGTWEFDYNQTIYNCDNEKVDYLKSKKENGPTIITIKKDQTFTGHIWGVKYFGTYSINNDTLISISNSPAMEGTEKERIIGEISDTLYLESTNCDQKDTLRYIRK